MASVMALKSAEIPSVKVCGSTPGGGRGLLDLLPVLVRAGQEEDVVAVQPLEARHHVGGDRGVGVADMRRTVHVIDRGRDVDSLGHWSSSVGAASGRAGEHADPGDDRLTFVQREAFGLVLQPRQALPQLAPGIKRTQRDQALLIGIRPAPNASPAPPPPRRRESGP